MPPPTRQNINCGGGAIRWLYFYLVVGDGFVVGFGEVAVFFEEVDYGLVVGVGVEHLVFEGEEVGFVYLQFLQLMGELLRV